ncbi:cytochrome P450 [Krasilnikovia sp. MM14-A1004]|uniref:cytochrome P450 n=1 Tax=Krasilnikovia sp. MM14-A1004 TaxID=3373541 RepID=UPI00399D4F0B
MTTAPAVDLPFLDITAPDFRFDSPAVAAAREASWCATTPMGLIVLRYAEMHQLLRDPRLAQNGERYLDLMGISDGPLYDWFVPMILHRQGTDHLRLRRLVSKAFAPRMIEDLRPFMRDAAAELTGALADRDECEFMADFADPMPVRVMSALLGVPAEDYDLFRRWSTDVGLVFSFNLPQVRSRVEEAVVGLHAYVDSLIEQRRADPRDDLLSALIAAEESGERLSTRDLRNLAVTLVFAGHDTTRNQLGLALVTFAAHPDQWRLLGARPELVPQAVEEVMRWSPSVPTNFRFAVEDLDLYGVHVPAGTFLMLGTQAASRDPRVHSDGDRFDITLARETPHLTFGGGPHFCLGAATARAEIAESLSALTSRLGPPSITAPVPWRPPTALYGPESLPLRFARR